MSALPDIPLSEQELTELDAFLLSEACDEEALTIDEAHGFLTALVVGPVPLAAEEWLVEVWREPAFADEEEARRMTDLMLRLYNEIAVTIASGRPFEPLVVEEEDEGEVFEVYEGWCFGFILGVELHQSHWEGLPKEQQSLMAPIAQLALLASEEEYRAWVELLPGAVAGLYAFWHPAYH